MNDEIELVLKELNIGAHAQRNTALFQFLVLTGFRISEALSITVGQVYDINTKQMKNQVIVKAENMKGGKQLREAKRQKLEGKEEKTEEQKKKRKKVRSRRSDINAELGAILLPLCEDKPANYPLFASSFNGRLKPISRQWFHGLLRDAVNKSGIQNTELISSHSLRKTFARKCLEVFHGDYLKTRLVFLCFVLLIVICRDALGHASVSSTEAYLPRNTDDVKSKVKAFSIASMTTHEKKSQDQS